MREEDRERGREGDSNWSDTHVAARMDMVKNDYHTYRTMVVAKAGAGAGADSELARCH